MDGNNDVKHDNKDDETTVIGRITKNTIHVVLKPIILI